MTDASGEPPARLPDKVVPAVPGENREKPERPEQEQDSRYVRVGPLRARVAVVRAAAVFAAFGFGLALKTWPSETGTAITVLATVAIAYFTRTLYVATGDMARTSRDTLNQLEREFRATHRPRVILRRLTFDAVPESAESGPRVRLEFANVGDAEAIIRQVTVAVEARMTEHPGQNVPAWLLERLNASHASTMDRRLANGDSYVEYGAASPKLSKLMTGPRTYGLRFAVVCVGFIEYTDAAGEHTRRTGFYRESDPDNRGFQRTDDRDFEYED